MSLSLSFPFVHPAGDILLACTRNRQRVLRNRLRDGGTGRDICTIFHSDRRDEVGIASDERIVTDGRAEFRLAIVIDRNGTAAHIDILSHIAIADIGKMRQFRSLSDGRILHFDKIIDLHAFTDMRPRTQMDELSQLYMIVDHCIVRIKELPCHEIADFRILNADRWPDLAMFSDFRAAFEVGHGIDDCIPTDFNVRVNECGSRIDDGNA